MTRGDVGIPTPSLLYKESSFLRSSLFNYSYKKALPTHTGNGVRRHLLLPSVTIIFVSWDPNDFLKLSQHIKHQLPDLLRETR